MLKALQSRRVHRRTSMILLVANTLTNGRSFLSYIAFGRVFRLLNHHLSTTWMLLECGRNQCQPQQANFDETVCDRGRWARSHYREVSAMELYHESLNILNPGLGQIVAKNSMKVMP